MIINDIFSKICHRGNNTPNKLKANKNKQTPALIVNRNAGNSAAIVLVHGFHGDASETWASFLTQLINDQRLNDWDVFSAGYQTNLSIDLPIWTSDPEIRLCAAGLLTKFKLAPLERYKAISLIAHSMGGLVVQRAILDSNELKKRLTHVVLFGTPSAGVSKATIGSRLKTQARDMRVGSDFITQLRTEWNRTIGKHPPFSFTAVAGETDAFIPASSSIDPFPISQQAVLPGNHLEIVQPDSTEHFSYKLLYKILTNSRGAFSETESARLAVEHKEFDRAIELLMPGVDGLDPDAVVTLALALETVGLKKDAAEVIERWNNNSKMRALDPIGVLAGRLKRRWLVSRQQRDLDRALELYSAGFEEAEVSNNHEQAYYHAINVAYLRLVSISGNGPPAQEVIAMAMKALGHVEKSFENQWSHATRGEACLILGEIETGLEAYRKAKKLSKTLRECDSMRMQAVAVAQRIFGEEGTKQIDEVFGFSDNVALE